MTEPTSNSPAPWRNQVEHTRVGIDLCRVADVRESTDRFGDKYLRRIYTDAELADCAAAAGYDAERLAARFAAKEAVVKVLRPTKARPAWTDIEVHRHVSGWCEMVLSGAAAHLATEGRIVSLSTSLTHEGDLAAAVVVATLNPENPNE